jgi:eukaryotic-like serine/threonine-protein kinase
MSDPIDQVNTNALLGQLVDGRYQVESVLGRGGMGVVFRAVQTSMQRPVAMKTLHPQFALAPEFFERFKREAEIASRLHHPNIITVFDFGRTSDGTCYYVMELLEGENLRQRVKNDSPMTLRQAAAVIEQATLGVGHAHKQNVIHRDIKPHNVMLSLIDGNEYVKVLDFGLVKAMEKDGDELTSTGQVLGTPQYMPPEQAGGDQVDHRSDLYSLTGVFYYCLTARSPFGAKTVRKALQAALTQKVPPISTSRFGAPVPEAIERFCQKGLAVDPAARFQSADEFIDALHAAIAETSDSALDAVPQNLAGTGKDSTSEATSGAPRSSVKAVLAVNSRSTSQTSRNAHLERPGVSNRTIMGVAALLIAGIIGAFFFMSDERPSARPQPSFAQQPENAGPESSVVRVALKTQPDGAEVLEGDVTLGTTPLLLTWDRAQKRTLIFRLAGFRDLEKSLKPDTDQEFEFSLEDLRKTGPTVKPPGKNPTKTPRDNINAFD